MSSTYSFICMNHDPGIEIADNFTSADVDRDALPGTVEAVRGTDHPECDLVIARESGAIVEVACVAPQTAGHGHAIPRWIDMDVIRLILQAREAAHSGVNQALARHFDARRCWPSDRIRRLRGVVDLEPWTEVSAGKAAPAPASAVHQVTYEWRWPSGTVVRRVVASSDERLEPVVLAHQYPGADPVPPYTFGVGEGDTWRPLATVTGDLYSPIVTWVQRDVPEPLTRRA